MNEEEEFPDLDFDEDTNPQLYRIYKSTVQRVIPRGSSLNSHAVYLIVLYQCKKILAWLGLNANKSDIALLKEIVNDIFPRDFGDNTQPNFPIIIEGQENTELLNTMLGLLWTSSATYNSRTAVTDRRAMIQNNAISLGILVHQNVENSDTNTKIETFEIRETTFAHPDANGVVPRVPFAPIQRQSIIYVMVGNQWDLWFARGVSNAKREEAVKFVTLVVEKQALSAVDNPNSIDYELLTRFVNVVEQGEETALFRRAIKIFTDFEPPGSLPKGYARAANKEESADSNDDNTHGNSLKDSSKHPKLEGISIDEAPHKSTAKRVVLNLDEKEIPSVPRAFSDEAHLYNDRPTDFFQEAPGVPRRPVNDGMVGMVRPRSDGQFNFSQGILEITPDMVEIREDENLPIEHRNLVMEESAQNPAVLLGYQVVIDEGLFKGVFVIVGVRKTMFRRKTFFHLAALDGDEVWIRLKRSPKKAGIRFRPLRQVAVLH